VTTLLSLINNLHASQNLNVATAINQAFEW